uniref:Uncharacterized protein n=1 Tax=Anas platyrhynchos TaxID=8839 RepID=A0A8B9QQF8_ANAPL
MRVLCVVFAVLLLFSMAAPGKRATRRAFAQGTAPTRVPKRTEWTFHQTCGKMYCCIPPPKKGK